MKITNKILSLSLICFMTVCFCGCEAEDDDKNTDLTLWEIRGTWTTVGCSNIPSSMDMSTMANVSFWLDTDYDGGERWYDIWSREIGDYYDVNLNGLTIETNDGSPIFDIVSFKETIMDVKVSKFPNVILTMKKFNGGFTNDDYKFKLVNSVWLYGVTGDNSLYAEYLKMPNNSDLKSSVRMYGNGAYLISFHQDGTGECAYRVDYIQGTKIFDYNFKWQLEDKILTIWTDEKEERQSKVSLVGIEGEVFMKYETAIW